ncbi:MAG: hypothetical protein AAF191_03305, partial [Verrucomicrobiota bacterium]
MENDIMSKVLDFFIVGAQKSATTFLHHAIAEHPAVSMPRGEISLFQPRHYSTSKIASFVDQMPSEKR